MNWVVPLIGAVGSLTKDFIARGKGEKDRKRMIVEFKNNITAIYTSSTKDLTRDVVIITGWQKIIGGIIAIDRTAARWEFTARISDVYQQPKIFSSLVHLEEIKNALEEAKEIEKEMIAQKGDARISWNEGGPDIEASMSAIIRIMGDMQETLKDFATKTAGKKKVLGQRQIDILAERARNIQLYTITFYKFWNGILLDLGRQSKEANTAFATFADKPLEGQLKQFAEKYPDVNSLSSFIDDATEKLTPIFQQLDDDDEEAEAEKSTAKSAASKERASVEAMLVAAVVNRNA